MIRHIPPELESAVAERGTLTDKLLVALIGAVNEQDAIHAELGNISRQLEELRDISRQLEQMRTEMSKDLMIVAGNVANLRR